MMSLHPPQSDHILIEISVLYITWMHAVECAGKHSPVFYLVLNWEIIHLIAADESPLLLINVCK